MQPRPRNYNNLYIGVQYIMANIIPRGSDSLDLGIDQTNWWVYYDRDSLTAASNSIAAGDQADYFSNVASKTIIQSNWPTNGVLPKGFAITIFRIRCAIVASNVEVSTLTANDVMDISQNSVFELYRNVTDLVVQCPLAMLADPMSGLYTPLTTSNQLTQPGSPGLGTLPDFGQIELSSEEAISARIFVPTAITTTTSSLSSVTIQVALDTKRWKAVS